MATTAGDESNDVHEDDDGVVEEDGDGELSAPPTTPFGSIDDLVESESDCCLIKMGRSSFSLDLRASLLFLLLGLIGGVSLSGPPTVPAAAVATTTDLDEPVDVCVRIVVGLLLLLLLFRLVALLFVVFDLDLVVESAVLRPLLLFPDLPIPAGFVLTAADVDLPLRLLLLATIGSAFGKTLRLRYSAHMS